LACLLASGTVAAQPLPGDALEARLRRGVELRRAGQDEAAFAEFEAAHALRAEPRTAAQLALVCQATGRWIRAEVLLREALAAPDDAWVRRNRVALEGALAVAERHLATLEVVGGAAEQEAHAQVRLNDEAVGTLPLARPVRVVAGAAVLEVRAEGFDPFVRRFEIAPGERVRERVSLVRPRPVAPETARVPVETVPSAPPPALAPPAAPAAPAAVTPRGERVSAAPWGGLALGSFIGAGVALGVGAAALVVREAAAASFNDACEQGATAGDCGSLRDRTAFSEGVAATALPVGLLLSAAGTYFVVQRARQASALRVAVTGRAFVVQCAWRF
jgi:hypothetical protein